MDVEVHNSRGRPVIDLKGELVCKSTYPSQPAFFWGDVSGEKSPRTRPGKIMELAMRQVVHGPAIENIGAFACPDSLEQSRNRKEFLS